VELELTYIGHYSGSREESTQVIRPLIIRKRLEKKLQTVLVPDVISHSCTDQVNMMLPVLAFAEDFVF
jgi:hypothetical protein